MSNDRLLCDKCGKENEARDYQCDCGNILDVGFTLVAKPDVEKHRKRLQEEQKHKEEKDETINDNASDNSDSNDDVVDKGNTETLEEKVIRESEEEHEVLKDMEEENTVIQLRPSFKLTNEQIGKRRILKTGKRPGVGRFICIECNEDLELDGKKDKLPPCRRCFSTKFVKERLDI